MNCIRVTGLTLFNHYAVQQSPLKKRLHSHKLFTYSYEVIKFSTAYSNKFTPAEDYCFVLDLETHKQSSARLMMFAATKMPPLKTVMVCC